jgi:hypothetical protein
VIHLQLREPWLHLSSNFALLKNMTQDKVEGEMHVKSVTSGHLLNPPINLFSVEARSSIHGALYVLSEGLFGLTFEHEGPVA